MLSKTVMKNQHEYMNLAIVLTTRRLESTQTDRVVCIVLRKQNPFLPRKEKRQQRNKNHITSGPLLGALEQ